MIMKRQQKTQTVVGVPINESAWQIIDDKKLHNANELVFPLLSASKTSATQYFRLWTEKAGIPKKIGWHTARHTFGTLALEGGADLYTVSKLLGHTDIATTQVYAKATDKLKREAVEKLPNLELSKKAELKKFRKAEGE
jgi:site-specific recombinase XerD